MGFQQRMMDMMMGRKSPEDMAKMMDEMMPKMMEKMAFSTIFSETFSTPDSNDAKKAPV